MREKNIMHSGHVMHMAGLYEMLRRDFRYDRPGAQIFVWDVSGDVRGTDDYTHTSLVERAYRQITESAWRSVECEMILVLTLVPGEPSAEKASFSVRNLHPSVSWSIEKDGAPFPAVRRGKVIKPGAGSAVTWADGVMRVTTSLSAEETYVVVRQALEPKRPSGEAEAPR